MDRVGSHARARLGLGLLVGPDPVEVLHEGVVQNEGDAHVQADSAQARHCSLVKSTKKQKAGRTVNN